MNDLAKLAMDAHGGLDQWRQLRRLPRVFWQGGVLWGLKGKDGILNDVHRDRLIWGRSGHRIGHSQNEPTHVFFFFKPDRVAIETTDGEMWRNVSTPASLSRDTFSIPSGTICSRRTSLDNAIWTYLNTAVSFCPARCCD